MGLYGSETYLGDVERCSEAVAALCSLRGSSVLVTGSTGLIGSFLVDVMLALGARVVAACRSQERGRLRFDACPFGAPELCCYDASMPNPNFPTVDYVIHAASNAHPASMMADPVRTVVDNVAGVASLLNWCESAGVSRMLYVSSGEVYGQAESGVAAFSEEYQGYVDPMVPRSCYPVAKRAAENVCASWLGDVECVVARLCHTFGPTATAADSRAASEFARKAAASEKIVLRSRGGQFRSWLHVRDAASGILTVLFAGKRGTAYNVASPTACASVAELADLFASAAGIGISYELESQTCQSTIVRQVLDSSRLEGLGWRAELGIEEAAARTVRVLKESLEVPSNAG